MSHLTSRPSPPHPDGPVEAADPPATGPPASGPPRRRRSRAWRPHAVLVLGGLVAAALGLGLLAVVVLSLWIGSPSPQGGPEDALHVAAALWLMAHGAGLTRTSTVSGEPVPVDLTPLLLVAVPLWLIGRAVRNALDEEPPDRARAARIAATVAAGYLLVGAAAVHYASEGPLRVDPLEAGAWLLGTTAAVSAAAVWMSLGRPRPVLRGTAGVCAAPVLRGAGLGVVVLLAGGLALTLLAVGLHGEEYRTGVERLGGDWSGRTAVALLTLALLPNAVVWATSYGLGPGFTLGSAGVVGPLSTTAGGAGPGLAPSFPLLAALPDQGPGTPLTWAVGALPLAAGLAVGVCAGRGAAPVPDPLPRDGGAPDTLDPRETALAVTAAALLCGAALALLAAVSGGALGTGGLSHVGPAWWAAGAAATGWVVLAGLPTALALRAWRLRERGAFAERARWRVRRRRGDVPGPSHATWHESGARRSRWAALKDASGGLMNDFTPRRRD